MDLVYKRKRRRRWSDNDSNFGPFTYASGGSKQYGVRLDTVSGDPDCDSSACIRIYVARIVLILWLPSLLRAGREYGALWIDDGIHVSYGPRTMDSRTDRSTIIAIPWLRWRHVRHSAYGVDGKHFASEAECGSWHEWFRARDACPVVTFEFDDYDGERITARTRLEEREWHRGTKWCKWLALFCRPRISRTLDIAFSKETGKEKGSWKGGTVGHSIKMASAAELHESAFRRYCDENRMRFVGRSA